MVESRGFDLVIVGSGIAGTALAASLAGRGLRLALVEAQDLVDRDLPPPGGLDSFDSRVSALTPRSRALLEAVDCWSAITGYRACPYTHMTVWDAEGTGLIEFDAAEVQRPELGYIVENRVVVKALLDRVRAATDVVLLSPARVAACDRGADGAMQLTLAGEGGDQLRADLVVAADGAMSPLRQMLGFETREWDYGHRALVCTVQTEHAHQATAWQRFLPSGPLAFLPLPGDGQFCSIVWSVPEARAEELLGLDEAAFCSALGEAFEQRLGRVLAATPRFAFPLRQRHAVDYVQPGVALIADAAHTIHPLAGQGINLGLQDVAALAEEVVWALGQGLNPGRLEVLRRYQRRRKGENLLMMAAMDGFKRLFEEDALPLRFLRNAGMDLVGRLGPVKQQLMRHAMGLG